MESRVFAQSHSLPSRARALAERRSRGHRQEPQHVPLDRALLRHKKCSSRVDQFLAQHPGKSQRLRREPSKPNRSTSPRATLSSGEFQTNRCVQDPGIGSSRYPAALFFFVAALFFLVAATSSMRRLPILSGGCQVYLAAKHGYSAVADFCWAVVPDRRRFPV